MNDPLALLGGLDPARFLREHWQKKPLLVRQAIPGLESPVTPEELAGLACLDEVDSRLILERGGKHPWELRVGPFSARDFKRLPEKHWSLLVQEVDRFVPEVATLLDRFRFVPNWRIDDVMVSFAPAGGSVGAHVDNYDVFLLQAHGRRRWRIGREPVADEQLVPDLDVRILEAFEPDAEWDLSPGDMLYLPPRVAHHGVALDPCMTFSIGFRAPEPARLLAAFAAEALEGADPGATYADPDLALQTDPGEISSAALARIRSSLREALGDDARLDRWFGRFITEPARAAGDATPDEETAGEDLVGLLRGARALRRASVARFAFIRSSGGVVLFVGGREYALERDLGFAAPLLTGSAPLTLETLGPHLGRAGFVELLADLVQRGHLSIDEE